MIRTKQFMHCAFTTALLLCGSLLFAQPNVGEDKALAAIPGVRYVSEIALADLDVVYNNGKPPVHFRKFFEANSVMIIPTWVFQAKGEPYDLFVSLYGRYIVVDEINEAVIFAARAK